MMYRLSSIVVCLALGACARAPIDDDAGFYVEPGSAEAGASDAQAEDAARPPPTADAAPQDTPDATVRDAAGSDASLADAGDARVELDAHATDAQAPPHDADASGSADAQTPPDAGAAMMCDLAPCQGHCPLATPCCSAIGTCGCQIADGLCILPPIGLN